MAKLSARNTTVDAIVRDPVPGLVLGKVYRRRRDIPKADGTFYTDEQDLPAVTYQEGAPRKSKYAGIGGWFLDGDQKSHFYLATEVEEVDARGLTESDIEKASCYVDTCSRPRYSQRLCTTHYGRARKLVLGDGIEWDQARKEVAK